MPLEGTLKKICVLQPDYSTSTVDYQYFDPIRNLQSLLPNVPMDHVQLNKLTTYAQLQQLAKEGYSIFVNLCEGYLEWSIPSIDVIQALTLLNLPFTGPTAILYDPPKSLMKYVAYCAGVATPAHCLANSNTDLNLDLQYPLFVKPAKAGDSIGIDKNSLVTNQEALREKLMNSFAQFPEMLIEEYIDGREFTILVAGNPDGTSCTCFKPIEYVFPKDFKFKTYALKTSELHPKANIPVSDPALIQALSSAAEAIFKGFNAVGYARLDFRMDATGKLYFLEINFTCSVFYQDGMEGSADYILKYDGIGKSGFLKHIIAEGLARFERNQKKYAVQGNSIDGYGIYANRTLSPNEIIFLGEGKSQRIITQKWVNRQWNEAEQLMFRKYAYPLSTQIFLLWSDDPSEWAPQNHSCDPNTAYDGLNVIALREIQPGEELTLDYETFLDDQMEPFQCCCKHPNCRGLVKGKINNSISSRESMRSA